jgi:hypothetical protein
MLTFGFREAPKDRDGLSSYTDCIVTLSWADGELRTLSILFTKDKNFVLSGKKTPSKKAKDAALLKLLKKYNIDANRIQLVGGGGGYYAKENPHIVSAFIKHYEEEIDWGKVALFRDAGTCFSKQRTPILPDLGVVREITYPPKVHELISPNDNKWHGVAKGIWRKMELDFGNHLESSLALMQQLDLVEPDRHKSWWTKNFFLDVERVEWDVVRSQVQGRRLGAVLSNERLQACLSRYIDIFQPTSLEDSQATSASPKNLKHGLDGVKWKFANKH